MASRTRGQRIKADVMTPLLKQIVISTLIRRKHHKLFYEILHSLDFTTLPPDKQLRAINYATTYCKLLDTQAGKDYEAAAMLQRQLAVIEKSLDTKGKQDDNSLDELLETL